MEKGPRFRFRQSIARQWESTGLVSRTVFKTDEAFARGLVGSIPTLSRHFSGKARQIEFFAILWVDGRVRDELLNPNLFRTIDEVRGAAATWLVDYNTIRPNSSLGYLTPAEFVAILTLPESSRL